MKPTLLKNTPLRTGKPEAELSIDSNEQIRRRAYELYEQRGREDGHDLDDWFQAESEMTNANAKAVTA